MAGYEKYEYIYSISMRSQIVGGPVPKPFAPFVPSSQFYGNDPSKVYVTNKLFGRAISPTHSDDDDNDNNKQSGRKPTQGRLSKAPNDIKKEAAKGGHNGGHDGPGPLPNRPVQPKPGKVDKKGMDLVNEAERLKKINVKDAPQPRPSLPRFNFSGGVINHKEAEKKFNGITI